MSLNAEARNGHDLFRVANDPESAPEILAQLSKSDDELIRGAVAYNSSTPSESTESLKHDSSEHVIDCLRKRGLTVEGSEL